MVGLSVIFVVIIPKKNWKEKIFRKIIALWAFKRICAAGVSIPCHFRVIFATIKKSPILIYGGSVNDKNIAKFSSISEINGFLIGGASRSPKKFVDIIKNYYT